MLFSKLKRKVAAYKKCFLNDRGGLTADGELILADLEKFCRVIGADPNNHGELAYRFGRQEVYRRICEHIGYDMAKLDNIKKLNEVNEHE